MERLTEKHYLGTDHYMKCSGSCNERKTLRGRSGDVCP